MQIICHADTGIDRKTFLITVCSPRLMLTRDLNLCLNDNALAETWCSAKENLDLKEKLRVSLERREKLLKEIQQVKRSPDFPQDG